MTFENYSNIHACGGVTVHFSEKMAMAIIDLISVLVAFALAYSSCHGQSYPFRNTSLSFEERVKVQLAIATGR